MRLCAPRFSMGTANSLRLYAARIGTGAGDPPAKCIVADVALKSKLGPGVAPHHRNRGVRAQWSRRRTLRSTNAQRRPMHQRHCVAIPHQRERRIALKVHSVAKLRQHPGPKAM